MNDSVKTGYLQFGRLNMKLFSVFAAIVLSCCQADSIAAQAQIQSLDTFTHIEGKPVKTWQQTSIQMLNNALKTGVVSATLISEDSSQKTVRLDLNDTKQLLAEGNLLEKIGIIPWRYKYQAKFGEIKNGVAKDAGIKEGDKVISVDGKGVNSWVELVEYIQPRAEVPIRFEVQRDSENLFIK